MGYQFLPVSGRIAVMFPGAGKALRASGPLSICSYHLS